jgi:hypothetical protein
MMKKGDKKQPVNTVLAVQDVQHVLTIKLGGTKNG